MFHKNASFDDKDIVALIRFKPQVWQEQTATKSSDRKMWERKIRTAPEGLYFPLPHFSVRALKISLDSRMREYYFHSVLAQWHSSTVMRDGLVRMNVAETESIIGRADLSAIDEADQARH